MRKLLFAAALFAAVSASAQDYSDRYAGLEGTMEQPTPVNIPGKTVSLLDYGGNGDGITLNTEPFRKAISALTKAGGGTLVVPQGVYMTGPVTLKSNIAIRLERNALVIGTEDKNSHFKPTDSNRTGRVQPLFNASKAHDVAIVGEGTVDGNGALWRPVKRSKVSDVEWEAFLAMGGTVSEDGSLWFPFGLNGRNDIAQTPEKQEAARADLIRFTDCERVLIEGITAQNSPRFHVHPIRCTDVVIEGVTVRCPWNAQNGDAIDISNCRRVLISKCIVDAGDDGICMKGGSGASGVSQGPCEDILIQDNTVYHGHGGFVIGSDVSGGMKNIVVRRCTFSGTDTGLRFKSGIGRGGRTENIRISDIVMNDIKDEAVIFECTYVDRGYSGKVGDGPKKVEYVPDFQDIRISNVICHGARTGVRSVGIEGLSCVKDVTITGSRFYYTGKATDIDAFSSISIENSFFGTF